MSPGRINSEVYNHYLARYPEEANLLDAFLPYCDVTRAERSHLGNSEVAHYFMKPRDQAIKGLLGISGQYELLVTYSPYPDLQARAIEQHDKKLAENRLRLDQSISLIVSRDPKSGQFVKDMLASDPDRAAMIGLSTHEVYGSVGSANLLQFVQQRHFTRDLFAVESPLDHDAQFFGRERTIAELSGRLKAGQNSGLFGLRRIGKTSVLFALQRRTFSSGIATGHYRDLSSAYHLRWWDLLALLIRESADQLNVGKTTRRNLRAFEGYEERTAPVHFGHDVEALTKHAKGNRLAFFLDEFEYVTFDLSPQEHWKNDFLSMATTMRSVHQNSKGKFCYVIAGVNPYGLEHERV